MDSKIKPVLIGEKLVGPGESTYIIAEIGINHNGDMAIAKQLIDVAVEAKCDAVKFQTRTVEVVYTKEELAKPRPVPRAILVNAIRRKVLPEEAVRRLETSDFENTTNGDLKRALEFTLDEYDEIDAYCKSRGIAWLTSHWDVDSVLRLMRFNHPAHKVASACNEDDNLLRCLRQTGKPIILSTGMTDMEGVRAAVKVIGALDLVILHCTSVYPKGTEYGDEVFKLINLRGIDTLREEFAVPVGFSSHDSGIQPTYAAVARGAVMIEKHITLERMMWGSDQGSSVEPREFVQLCKMVRELSIVLGDGVIDICPAEKEVAKKLRRVRR